MKKYKSGAQKRKEAALAKESAQKLTKVTHYFSAVSTCVRDDINQSKTSSIVNAETEPLENCTENLPETSISLPQPSFIPLSNDPVFWPATISDAQRCDIIKRGPEQINIAFPYNSAKRRFSSVHYERTMINGETIHRSWLLYSQQSDQIFCFCCKLFGNTASPFCSGMNTWEGISKKLKDHKNSTFHKKYFSQWMLLKEGIREQSTIDMKEMQLFLNERSFWRNVLERLIDIVIFLSERNLAFRGSNEILGSPQNGNVLGLFELLAKRDSVLSELKNRVIRHTTKQHYLSSTIQNELIHVVAREVEKNLLKQLKKAVKSLTKLLATSRDCWDLFG